MVKYRGKHEGKTRGQYVRAAFISEQVSLNDNYQLYNKLDSFLNIKGYHIQYAESFDPDEEYYTRSDCYHLGGASISIKRWGRRKSSHFAPAKGHFSRIKLASNDGLDDIIELIIKRFPTFHEIDSDIS